MDPYPLQDAPLQDAPLQEAPLQGASLRDASLSLSSQDGSAIQGQRDAKLLQLPTCHGRGVVIGYRKSEGGVRCLFPLKQAVSDSLCFLGHSVVKKLHLCLKPLELLLHRLLRILLDLGSCPVIE